MTLARALAPLLLAALAAAGGTALASGPVLPSMVFVSQGGFATDAPPAYAADRLGVVMAGFNGRRLFIAYRRLMGRPLTAAMMAELAKPCCEFSDTLPGAVGAWTDARKAVPDAPPLKYSDTDPHRIVDGDPYVYVLNCAPDAFRTAAAVLADRVARHGADAPAVRDWLAGQDQVFRVCSTTDAAPPADAPPDAPAWLRADRVYQQAAAALYGRRYGDAAARFTAIAADAASPWNESAPYLVARIHARAVADATDARKRMEAVEAYRAAAKRVLDDPTLADWRPDIGRLDALVAYHAEPQARARALETMLLAAPEDAVPAVEVEDLVTLARRHPNASDFTAWVAALRNPAETRDDTLARWRATGGAPWLVAALMATGASDPTVDELLAAAATVEPNSSAYASVAWHRVRLLIGIRALDEARAEVERVLTLPDLDPSSRNQFRAHGLALARSLEEFAAYAPRRALFVYYPSDEWMTPPSGVPEMEPDDTLAWRAELKAPEPHYLDTDTASVANTHLPIRRLAELARTGTLPAHVRRDLTLAAWTRAALLDDAKAARGLGAEIKAYFPALAGDLDAHAQARDGARRRFLAAFILLKLPGASPQVEPGIGYFYERDRIGAYGPRWWEGASIGEGRKDCILRCRDAAPADAPRPSFLTDADVKAAEAEAKALERHADASGTLGRTVLDWARANPGDPRVPEALHLAVRATRFVHTPTDVSRRAFQLLHRRYATSPWAAKTPFWY